MENFKRKNIIRLGLLLLVELEIIWIYVTPVLSGSFLGFPLDDSWIYAVFARRFAGSLEIAFNSAQPAVGFTSSLWFLILSLGCLFHISPVVWSLLAGCVFQFIAAWFFSCLIKEFLIDGSTSSLALLADFLSWLGGLLILLCGPLIWYSLSGMETSMFLGWGLPAVYFLSRRRYWGAGLFLGLLLVTRIEGLALWGLALLYSLYIVRAVSRSEASKIRHSPDGEIPRNPRDNRDKLQDKKLFKIFKKLLPLICIPAIFLGLELLKNIWLTGGLLPTTFAGRKWLSVPAGGRGVIAYIRIWLYGLKISLLPPFLQTNPFIIIFWIVVFALALITGWLVVRGAYFNRRKISGLLLLLLWGLAHNLVYIIILPSPSQAGRYQAVNFILFWLLVFLPIAAGILKFGSSEFKEGHSGLWKAGIFQKVICVFLALLLGTIIFLDLFSTFKWKTIYLSSVRHINDVHIASARWVDKFLPSRSRVAAFDIGALKYFSPGTEVIDLGGLVDRDFAAYLEKGEVVDYLKKKEAGYLAMVELQNSPGWIFDNLKIRGDPRLHLKPQFGIMLKPEIYRLHYREAANTFPKIVVYKIEWIGD